MVKRGAKDRDLKILLVLRTFQGKDVALHELWNEINRRWLKHGVKSPKALSFLLKRFRLERVNGRYKVPTDI